MKGERRSAICAEDMHFVVQENKSPARNFEHKNKDAKKRIVATLKVRFGAINFHLQAGHCLPCCSGSHQSNESSFILQFLDAVAALSIFPYVMFKREVFEGMLSMLLPLIHGSLH